MISIHGVHNEKCVLPDGDGTVRVDSGDTIIDEVMIK